MSAAPVFLRTVPACGAPPAEEKESTDPSQRAEKPEVTIYNRPYLPPSGHSFDDGRTASAAEEYSGTPASGTLAGDDLPRFHFFHLLRGNHSVAVEHARGFLQVFERGDLPRFLTRDFSFRRDIVIDVFAARHIVKSALRFVRRSFKSARVLRQAVRRVLYIQYDRLIADCRLPPRFFQ